MKQFNKCHNRLNINIDKIASCKKNKKSAVKQQKNMSTTTRQTGVKIITQISNFVDCTYTLYMYIKNQHMQIQLQTNYDFNELIQQ